jgi:co-chaperonin GroES (HSP10)
MYNIDTEIDDTTVRKLPQPAGYRLLIAVLETKETTDGGVFLPDKLKDMENTASIIGFVLKAGPDAYADSVKFPTGPWCKEGDFVIFRSYSGTRFKLRDKEFRLINDDTVEAVVDDPRGYTRA